MHLPSLLVITACLLAPAAEPDPEAMVRGLQEQVAVFTPVEFPADGAATLRVALGDTVATIADEVFDGLRFTAPADVVDHDFVWYGNLPESWGNWYLCPVRGEATAAFRNWLTADQLYRGLDLGATDRLRFLQTLTGDYFEPGADYILWFRRVGEAGGDEHLHARLAFVPTRENWDHAACEEALALEPQDAAAQVAALDSRGGRILLDRELFHPTDASERIAAVFTSIRQTSRFGGGFFITMETVVPPCRTSPAIDRIVERYGQPDLIQSAAEVARVQDQDLDADERDRETWYYDHFGFEVDRSQDPGRVLRVRSHAQDYSVLAVDLAEPSYARLAMKNLTVLRAAGREVGRLYYFLESGKTPLCVLEPPIGSYRAGEDRLDYHGAGAWTWRSQYPDGSLARRIPLVGHRFHGTAEGFHANGKPSFVAAYAQGQLEGELVEYAADGTVLRRRTFSAGEPVAEPEAAAEQQ